MVKYLVERHGCDLHYKDHFGFTSLDLATSCNHQSVINYVNEKFGINTGYCKLVS